MLTSNQEREFKILQQGLIHAETSAEIDHYSNKIYELIDMAKIQNQIITNLFSKEQLELYKKYRQKLIDAKYIGEVRYYGIKLHQLIDEVLKKGAYYQEYNLTDEQIAAYYEYQYKMKSSTLLKSKYRKKIKEIIPEEILLKIQSTNNI